MGRKAAFSEKPKSGPGKKAKKQQPPELETFLPNDDNDTSLSHRQRIRVKKRALKAQKVAEQDFKKIKLDKSKDDDDDSGCDVVSTPGRKIKTKKKEVFPSSDEDDSDVTEEPGKLSALNPFDSDISDEDEFSDDKDESDTDDDDIEKQSKKIDEEKRKMEAENEEELQSQKVQIEIPTLEEVKKEMEIAPDMAAVSLRIKDLAFVLSDFNSRREPERTRSEYISILEHDLCAYYTYNEFLIKKLMEIFPHTELLDFLDANETPRPITIRTNTLKTRRKQLAQSLISKGVNLDTIPWSKVGMVVYSTGSISLGSTTEYLAGHYLLQGASSFLPVVSLAPKEKEKVLDLCAAPGGKSSHIAAMMRNTGILFSNDRNKMRTKALIGNFHRMGISNAVITSLDGRIYSKIMPSAFDRCILDAPCSGTGVISKDEEVKMSKDATQIKRCSHLQKELLLAAIDCVDANSKTGGYICYSTCSILLEENEEVIKYGLAKRNVKLVPTELDIGVDGFTNFKEKRFDKGMALCRRIYPHTNNMDGFFVAKLKKFSNDIPKPKPDENEVEKSTVISPSEKKEKENIASPGNKKKTKPNNSSPEKKNIIKGNIKKAKLNIKASKKIMLKKGKKKT